MRTSAKENGLEVKVGLFLCIGLLIVAGMILEFGLGGKQGLFKKYYSLVVDLPDADGLLKNSQVVLGGASVGFVATKPVLSNTLGTVRVILKVDEAIKIPVGSTFEVGTSGLLGDKYVVVKTGPKFDPSKFDKNDPKQSYQPVDPTQPNLSVYNPSDKNQYDAAHPELQYKPGDAILGESAPGIPEAVKKISDEMDEVQEITAGLKNGILSPESQKEMQSMVAGFNTTSQNLASTSAKFPDIGKGAKEAVDKANQIMTKLDSSAENLQATLQNARDLIDRASHGEGLIGQLINNRQLADNFNALIVNMREHGPVFYHDTYKKDAQPTPAPRKPR